MKYTGFSVNHRGIRYWFEHNNPNDEEYPYITQVLIDDLVLIESTCSCTHGTIQLDSFKLNEKICTHIKKSIKFLKEKELIK